MSAVTVREERPGDEGAIRRVTAAAFEDHPHSEGAEPDIVDALRAAGDLTLSLVAQTEGEIVGHAAFSPAILSSGDAGWLTLGPISVRPDRQRRGFGTALIRAGAANWREAGGSGIVLIGDPALYARFGFVRGTPLHVAGALADYFQVLAFTAAVPAASVSFAPAFGLTRLRER